MYNNQTPIPELDTCIGADVYNKIDSISIEQLDKIARQPNSVVISCEMDLKCDMS